MKYTAGEAAKATGVSTATISRALKSGKISGSKDDSGAWQIDPAELHRVYPPTLAQDVTDSDLKGYVTPHENGMLQAEIDRLSERLTDAEARRAEMAVERERERDQLTDQIEDLRQRLTESDADRRRLTAQITDQRGPRPRWRWPWQR